MAVLHFGIKSIMLQDVMFQVPWNRNESWVYNIYFFSCAIMSVFQKEKGVNRSFESIAIYPFDDKNLLFLVGLLRS